MLSTLSYLFDEKYTELMGVLDPAMDSFDALMYLNRELFQLIENSVSLDLLAQLYATQLLTKSEKHLLDHNRIYYRLLRRIVLDGQSRGELSSEVSANEIVKAYALCERSLLYDWCLCNGEYSLYHYAARMMPMFLSGFRSKQPPEKNTTIM